MAEANEIAVTRRSGPSENLVLWLGVGAGVLVLILVLVLVL